MVWLGDAIGLHQPAEAHAVALGDLGEGFARAHRDHLLGLHTGDRQHGERRRDGQNQGGEGAAHGLPGTFREP